MLEQGETFYGIGEIEGRDKGTQSDIDRSIDDTKYTLALISKERREKERKNERHIALTSASLSSTAYDCRHNIKAHKSCRCNIP